MSGLPPLSGSRRLFWAGVGRIAANAPLLPAWERRDQKALAPRCPEALIRSTVLLSDAHAILRNMHQPHAVQVSGALFLAFGQACVNLHFYIDDEAKALFKDLRPEEWYPLENFEDVLRVVAARYSDPAPILEQVGIEMMKFWYEVGPGKQHVKRGTDFLRFQTSSEGYYSVIRGDPARIGDFTLVDLNEKEGTAVVRSTTPFDKDMERGVLRGGMALTQDLFYIDIDNSADVNTYQIEFH
ncbi:MAG: hypothetical protein AVDCRST_MAG93-3226 [uncultured Chloroflexia bacterium]|uniref:Uncharacterized protein n=1 Tax=uncultured Chloroflexia bacterium TaxID=1672391 RepID=A0A6J4JLC1_9CHLR|nr:MAG: hypothetical protein AVDCRST_MAG93-3226 [uncultured Chloroflexia bacterium]